MRQVAPDALSPDGVAIQIWQGEEFLPEPCPQDDAVLPGDHLAAAGEDPPALLILSQPLPAGLGMRDPALCLQPPPARRSCATCQKHAPMSVGPAAAQHGQYQKADSQVSRWQKHF